MADCGKDILLAREGTEQNQRYMAALNPDSFQLNDFGLKEWMKFAWNFAGHVNYFSTDNSETPSGNWQDFFRSEGELEAFLKEVEQGLEVTPHLALFVAFVRLLDISKQHFNTLSRRHLDFYFHEVLKLEKQAAVADSVHVVFELAKNAVEEKIGKGSQLDAGKDAGGHKLIFETGEELILNPASVARIMSIYNDHDHSKLKAASVANSFDGEGAGFPDKIVKWWPFGYYEPPAGSSGINEYPELKDAKIGFAISGSILELKEGERDVQISLKFETALAESVSADDLSANVQVFCSGEKGWLGPMEILKSSSGMSGKIAFSSGTKSNDTSVLNLLFRIPKDEKAIVKYDSKIHKENFKSAYPVCRVLIKTENTAGHQLYRALVDKKLSSVSTGVYVKGIENLMLSSDIGDINASKPFYPFGTQPVKKSKFNIGYPELFSKKWSNLQVKIDWKNTPEDFRTWYAAYRTGFRFQMSPVDYMKGVLTVDYLDSLPTVIEVSAVTPHDVPARAISATKVQFDNLIVGSEDYFTAAVEMLRNEEWEFVGSKKSLPMFDTQDDDGSFSMNFDVSNPDSGEANGPVRLSLNHTFLHEMYPRLYAVAMSSEDKNVLIPNEPYTPFVEKITLDYTAAAEVIPLGKGYEKNDFEIYHEHPFGQAVESIERKLANKIHSETEASSLYAVPTYCKGGELLIGLENAKPQQNVSLLIQVLEGSENPEVDSFVGKQKVEWWVLCSNDWKQLDSTAIITNNTDNLLKSGILKFTVPKEATVDNTLLPAGYTWLKARIHKTYNAVSKAIGIHAQAVKSELANNANNLSHLSNGLQAGTISKMVFRLPKVKALSQPYSSFGGKPEESDEAFYRRVSERLRHKNRAVTLWDYEHLVLEEFPQIHKVKCLNHSCSKIVSNKRKTRYLAPGSVVVVVIPDIANKNVFDIYKPRVSKATLNQVENCLKRLNSPLVNTVVINPEYEEVRLSLRVQFYAGYDEVYYKKVLRQDLTKLLSPWAFDNSATIRFGVSLHKSVVINYVEKLEYVDFVSDVKLFQKIASTGEEKEVTVAAPSSPEAILVSSKAHDVMDVINNCTKTEIESAEKCQS